MSGRPDDAVAARRFDAVVFDFGGVLITPITTKVTALAVRHGTTTEVMYEVLMGPRYESTSDHPWHRSERGEVAVADMQALLGPWAEAAGVTLHGDEMTFMFDQTYLVNRQVEERVRALQADGYTTALLTNSVVEYRPTLEREIDLSIFDEVIDSSEVGARKPEPEIYRLTTARVGGDPSRVVFLDDFVQNVVAARAEGWTALLVVDVDTALAELDRVLAGHDPA